MLDSTYRPVRAIGWRRAIILDLTDRVDVLETYDQLVRAASIAVQLPAVVRLRRYLRYRKPRVVFSRDAVLRRDAHRCQYCGCQLSRESLTIDHVMPRSRAGATSWVNVVAACSLCNRTKGDRTPAEAKMPLAKRPQEPMAPMEDAVPWPRQWRGYLLAS